MNQVSSTVVVIGAAGGIGQEIVRLLAVKHDVIGIVMNDQQAAEAQAAGSKHTVQCDISNEESATAALAELDALIPSEGLKALIHTAAIQPVGAIEAATRGELERLFAVNVFGTLQMAKGLIPYLRRANGRMVLFSSMAGRVTSPILGAYSASKFALEAFANALRMEMKGAVAVSLIEPGGVSTPMAAAQGDLIDKAVEKLPAHYKALYESFYLNHKKIAAGALKHASTPEAVARVAVDAAVGVKHPKARYVVGLDAKLTVLLGKVLPTALFDSLMYKAFSK